MTRNRRRWLWLFISLALLAAACASVAETEGVQGSVGPDIEIPIDSAPSGADDAVGEGPEAAASEESSTTSLSPEATTPASEEPSAEPVDATEVACASPSGEGRVDIGLDGNRLSAAAIDLSTAATTDVLLPGVIQWVVPSGAANEWIAVLTDGQLFRVSSFPSSIEFTQIEGTWEALLAPPVITSDATLVSPLREHDLFDDPLPDGRVVRSDSLLAVLSTPTDRYDHAVLGDAIEAAAIEWVDLCEDSSGRIDVPDSDVIEGIAPILADVDDDCLLYTSPSPRDRG